MSKIKNDSVVLVVDDEVGHADGLAEALEKHCAKAIAVYSGNDAVNVMQSEKVDVVVTDLQLGGDMNGLDVLEQAKKISLATEVILITAYATIDTCKEAIRRGAYDYLTKPIDIDQLRVMVAEASKRALLSTQRMGKADQIAEDEFIFNGIRGKNVEIKKIFDVIRRVAPTNISVLIEGSSGTGKELMAQAIHDNSPRKDKPFRPLNCAGLTETLLESELFGHSKGAFTGAAADRKGLFEIADKGTLFLDEIGDMPLTMQAKLLRVLEDGIVVPVGSNKSIAVDVRVISATNHNLTELVEQKKFRQDLYFRIKGVSVTMPSLVDRRQDIAELAEYFLKEATDETGSKITKISPAAMETLRNFDWPGNVRQLRNCIKTMVVMCETDALDVGDIPLEIYQPKQLAVPKSQTDLAGKSLNELEKQAITDTLAKTQNNREQAAKILGIGERTLYRKIKEYGL